MSAARTSQTIRRHLFAIGGAAAFMIGGIGIMSASTQLSGAVVSSGSLVVESNVKKVQHPAGGVVKTLLVHEGSHVIAGDVLIRLDETVANANYAAISTSLWELEARQARLEAERDGRTDITFPPDLLHAEGSEAGVAAIIAGEQRLIHLRRDASEGQKAQLHKRVTQLHDEIAGLQDQLQSKEQEAKILKTELTGVETLWDKKLVSITRLTALQRDAARLLGDRGKLRASIAESEEKISETELQIIQIDQDMRSAVAKELAEVRSKRAETAEKRIAALDTKQKLDIRAPQAGVVNDLAVFASGGVITPGETIMTIVPDHDDLLVETHIAPQDIDQLRLGQTTAVRFANFDSRSTPEIEGTVSRIGADTTQDDKAAAKYFVVRIAIAPDQIERLGDVRLMPGMPVQVFVRTHPRTMLSYLMKPLADQTRRAFREK